MTWYEKLSLLVLIPLFTSAAVLMSNGSTSAAGASAREVVEVLGGGLGASIDGGHTAEIRESIYALPVGSTFALTKARCYVAVRRIMPAVDRSVVLAVVERACAAEPVVPDVVEFAREMAFVAWAMPSRDVLTWSNVAYEFRKQSGGDRPFGREELNLVRSLAPGTDPTEAIGIIAATYATQFDLRHASEMLRRLRK